MISESLVCTIISESSLDDIPLYESESALDDIPVDESESALDDIPVDESESVSGDILIEVSESALDDIPVDQSVIDQAEEDIIEKMFHPVTPCCSFRCNFVIPKDVAIEQRRTFQEMSKQEQDIVILSQLQVLRRSESLVALYRSKQANRRVRLKEPNKLVRKQVSFMYCSLQICKRMYFFLHDVGEKRYKNLCRHFDTFGIQPRVHKSKGKAPKRGNELTPDDISCVIEFIKTFADRNGLGLPGKTKNVKKLPWNESKVSIHRQYCTAMESLPGVKVVARSTFSTIWKKYCPYIVFAKPPTPDLGVTVKKNRSVPNVETAT